MLRIDINLLFTALNLLLLYILMRIFLFKPIHKILDERQAAIDHSLAEAEAAKAAAASLEEARRNSMKGIEDEKRQVLAEAQQRATVEYDRIVEAAHSEATGIVKSAAADAENQRTELLQKAQAEIAGMVVEATARIVASRADKESDMALYDEFLKKAGEKHD